MDYKELLGDREFNSPEEICEWMDSAATAITDLLVENQALRNVANGFKDRAEKAEAELQRYVSGPNY